MKNYIIVNAYYRSDSFKRVFDALEEEFALLGQSLITLTNANALSYLKKEGGGAPILFWDKDIYLASTLQKWGYRLINDAKTIEICDDKAKTYLCLLGKVDMPETVLAPFSYSNVGYGGDYSFVSDAAKRLGLPMIIKKNKGSFGEQVYLVGSEEEAVARVRSMDGDCNLLFQKYIASSSGRDMRVYVVGGKAIAWAQRSNISDYRSNVELGGVMSACSADPSFLRAAEIAAREVGAHFAGVDLLFGENGPLVCEVNSNALFGALSKASGVNVARSIVNYYMSLKG